MSGELILIFNPRQAVATPRNFSKFRWLNRRRVFQTRIGPGSVYATCVVFANDWRANVRTPYESCAYRTTLSRRRRRNFLSPRALWVGGTRGRVGGEKNPRYHSRIIYLFMYGESTACVCVNPLRIPLRMVEGVFFFCLISSLYRYRIVNTSRL